MLRKIRQLGFLLCVLSLAGYTALRLFLPGWGPRLPFQFYTVISGSMEPTIPTYSLVLVRHFSSPEEVNLEQDDIVTFRANRFGTPVIITHRFDHTEMGENGEVLYRTRAEGSQHMDPYDTTAGDLLGTYVFHIPYAGKLPLFLQSKFGVLWICEMASILLIRTLIQTRWREKEAPTPTSNM